MIDGNRKSGIFNITGNNVTINNLIFKNGKSETGGIIDSTGEVTLRNVTFIANNMTFLSDHITYNGGAIANHGGKINCQIMAERSTAMIPGSLTITQNRVRPFSSRMGS